MNENTTTAPTTVETIAAMNDQEIADFNRKLTKLLAKKIAITLAVSAAALIAMNAIDKRIENDDTNE